LQKLRQQLLQIVSALLSKHSNSPNMYKIQQQALTSIVMETLLKNSRPRPTP